MAHRTALLAGSALLVFGGVACSSSQDATTSEDATRLVDGRDEPGSPVAAGAADAAAGGSTAGRTGSGGSGSSGASGGGAVPDVAAVDLDVELAAVSQDRRIVYRGKLEAVVDDVAVASGAARDAVAAEGGFLFGQEATDTWAQLVFKVPSPRFDATFDAVAAIGDLRSRFLEADDVTEQYVDLDSRRETLAVSIGRLRGFLEDAGNVDEISRLESELTRREAEHDVIAGKLRVLDERTELATLTVTYTVDDPDAIAPEEEATGPPGFGSGLSTGWDAVTVAAAAVATAIGFALPFVPAVVAVGILAWWWRRLTARSTPAARPAPGTEPG